MNQDTYTLRQLLVGFRNEYLKAKKELDELNQMLENYSNGKYDYQLSLFYPFFNSQLDAGLIIRIKQKKKHDSARIREKFAEAWHRSIQKKYNENGM